MPVGRSDPPFLPKLMEGRWFAHLSQAVRDGLVREARTITLAPAQRLFARDDRADGLYAVLAGAIEIGAVDADGHLAVLTIVEPSAWFGEIAIIDGLLRTHDATAIRTSVVLHVPYAAVIALLDQEPVFWRDLGRLVAEKLRLTFEVTETAMFQSAPQRLAARLLMIADGYGGAAVPQRHIHLSQDQVSALLSLSRQTVNRILKGFEADGLVRLRQGSIELRDPAALRRMCS